MKNAEVKLATAFVLGMALAFGIAAYQVREAIPDSVSAGYKAGVTDMAEICKAATDKVIELQQGDKQ